MGKPQDIIDANAITDSTVDLSYDHGFTYSLGLRIAMTLFGIIGAFATYDGSYEDSYGYFIGPPIILIALYALTAKTGTDISLENNYIREYTKSFWIKKGKWIPTSLFPDITVLRMGRSIGVNHIYSEKSAHVTNAIYSVHLLIPNHRKRILLHESTSAQQAHDIAKLLADKMDKKLVVFNPVISKATRDMRYERH